MCIDMALLPCILFCLAGGGALATAHFLILLLAALLLLQWPISPLLLLSLWTLLQLMLLLLLELGVARIVLDCANLVHMMVQLLPSRVLLPGHEGHLLYVGQSRKGVFLLLLFLVLNR